MELGIVSSVVEKTTKSLVDRIWCQIQYLVSYDENIENLKKGMIELDGKTARVKESVEEAENNVKSIYEDVKEWLKRVEDVKEEANGILEGNVQMTYLYCRCPNIKSRYSLSRKAKTLSSKVQTLIEKSKFDEVGYHASKGQKSYLSSQDFENFESRSLTMNKVLETLKDPKIKIIGLCGMAGVGKTKLALEIMDRVKEEKSFDKVAFATVQTADVKKIQGELAAGLRLDISDIKDSTLETAKRLSERLDVKDEERILVILDDVWPNCDFDLASLGIPNRNGQKRLKVMLTSRYIRVCDKMGAQKIIEVQVLKKEEAWLLFKEISGISDDGDDDDLKHIAENVAKECGGLPLAIVCIGGMLKNKDIYVWNHVLEQLRTSSVTTIKGEQNLVFKRIELSYEALEDKDYKSLLLLCSLFPEDFEIPIEILVRYVKGLEMPDSVMALNKVRNMVDTIVDHLKDCYLLSSSKKELNIFSNEILYDISIRQRYVNLHDAVRDICLSIMATKEGQGFMLRHVCREISPNISMEEMKDLRVLDLKSFGGQSLSSLLQCCLTSLRTLCLEECNLETQEISSIGCLKMLEVLSFYGSILLGFPKEIAQLTNLKLLDLRFEKNHPFPSSTLLGLNKLEELYMGYYEPENKELAKQSWIIEAHSLSHLTTLQVKVDESDILLQILGGLDLKKMERFHIACHMGRESSYRPYDFQRYLELSIKVTTKSAGYIFNGLLNKSYSLYLRVESLRNVVPELDNKYGLNNLRDLKLAFSNDLEYFIDASNVEVIQRDGFKNLESLRVDSCKNLKGLCLGRIQPPWLRNVKRIGISYCHAMTSLFSQSISKCLMHLENLSIWNCERLEEVICMEENTEEKVVEFPNLKTSRFSYLQKFQGFFIGNAPQAFLNQVSFPALEDLYVFHISCSEKFVGFHMPIGSLHNLKSIMIHQCKGLSCFAKADSLKLLQNLKQFMISECKDVEVIFDLEGLKVTQGLILLPQLDELKLGRMRNLASIWRMFPQGILAFRNLNVLDLAGCHRLKYLLPNTPSFVNMLVSLEEIRISGANSMEDIIGGEGGKVSKEVVDDNIKEFVFPKLRSIRLFDLENLKSFSREENYGLIFPSLTELKIRNCPQFNKFSYGKLSTPRLQQVITFSQDNVPIDLKENVEALSKRYSQTGFSDPTNTMPMPFDKSLFLEVEEGFKTSRVIGLESEAVKVRDGLFTSQFTSPQQSMDQTELIRLRQDMARIHKRLEGFQERDHFMIEWMSQISRAIGIPVPTHPPMPEDKDFNVLPPPHGNDYPYPPPPPVKTFVA